MYVSLTLTGYTPMIVILVVQRKTTLTEFTLRVVSTYTFIYISYVIPDTGRLQTVTSTICHHLQLTDSIVLLKANNTK